jgi:phosphocarrier protein HPr
MGILSRKSGAKASRQVEIVNKLGLHARPCSKFVKLAANFACEVWVAKDSETVNGKSIMGLMMLAAGIGSKLTITCEGADAEEALAALEKLILSKFDED